MTKVRGVTYKTDDEYLTPLYAIKPIMKYIPLEYTIWCPFDKSDSNIVKIFRDKGNTVIETHIEDGYDFFDSFYECDVIISNPPYSLRTELFERLFYLKKKFCMLMGNLGMFDHRKRFELFKNNPFEIMYLDKRVNYFKETSIRHKNGVPFSSSWITSGILPKQIVFENIENKLTNMIVKLPLTDCE